MKYMGSKARFHKELLSIILDNRKENQYYVEPFAGGMNMISEVIGNRIANDIHYYLIEMWKELVSGWIPKKYSREEHKEIRLNKNHFPLHVVGYVGFCCSYSGVYFGGYAGETKTKENTIRDYQTESLNNILKQVPKLQNVIFQNKNYYELEIPQNSIIYCDPPYENTSNYKTDKFNHIQFWEWCRNKSKEGHSVYISEYNAPDDFECIWSKQVKSSLSANGKSGGSKTSTEKLFRFNKF